MSQQQVSDKVPGVRLPCSLLSGMLMRPNGILIQLESLVAGHLKTIRGQAALKATGVRSQRVTEHGTDASAAPAPRERECVPGWFVDQLSLDSLLDML